MGRRRKVERRTVAPDPKYDSELVAHFINNIMRRGKKSVAEKIVYRALDRIREQREGEDPLEVLVRAVDKVKPRVEVKSRRVGGATYQIPIEVSSVRQRALALRWIIQFAKGRKGMPYDKALALELLDACNNQGNAIKKREDTHKMAQANKAFAHYRW
jgi:small subunit ribosomal protein S7